MMPRLKVHHCIENPGYANVRWVIMGQSKVTLTYVTWVIVGKSKVTMTYDTWVIVGKAK